MKKIFLLLLVTWSLSAKTITTNEAYAHVILLTDEIHEILKYYHIPHDHEGIIKSANVDAKLKPRNVWQKAYEIMIKINILRNENNLPTVEPVSMNPILNMNPNMVFGQTQRILTEFHIFKTLMEIEETAHKEYTFQGKTSLDVYNGLSHLSASLDELNKGGFTPSYVFGENMRIYDDLTVVLQHLNIRDETIPAKKDTESTPKDTFELGMQMLSHIKQLQIKAGIEFVDFSSFEKELVTPSDVFTITSMIIAELQTIKAYIGLDDFITPAASKYNSKTPIEVDQLMNWNLRKLSLINNLEGQIK